MTTIRRFCCDDFLRFASVNLDHLTETFNMSFYMTYLARWPDYFHSAVSPGGRIMDMRKALSQDVEKKSIIPLKRPITPDELEYD
nr:unnamed protein product [Digitaria exilis]